MGARWQPPQEVFGADDCEHKRPSRAIESSTDKGASWSYQSTDRCKERVGIGNVLDDLEGQYSVEPFAGFGKGFGRSNPVINCQAYRTGVGPRSLDRIGTRINCGYPKTEPGHRFGNEPPAAANVEQTVPAERSQSIGTATEMREQTFANKLKPHRIDAV